ncbi:DUF3999 domain-containing protein [Halomonas icarae]|uniref:DUF3999 family protein n=1 Tax=Halomonas icarae TaxID=2691040 RepID=A0A7X4VXL7_9GAMM|nr:DUF3999 domain-containing protein [Halomonas icarae]MDR5902261.1 DUF3999 domain-containing protein [Halomonas icarae]NAW12071.1 DUF3999 family protein [Halomonas icarae]
MRCIGIWALLLWPGLAVAEALEVNWQHAWPLQVESPAAAYRLTLPPEVYRSLHTPTLVDLQVVDARGQAVPTLLQKLPTPISSERAQGVPWFPLPAPPSDTAYWELIGETDALGRLRRIESRGTANKEEKGEETSPRSAALVDLSGLEDNVSALSLSWASGVPVDSLYRVEASDDLETWRPVLARGRLLDISHDGDRLVRRRLELADTSAPFLRLRPLPGQPAISIVDIQAVVPGPREAVALEWVNLDGERVAADEFHYRLPGRPPISLADVENDTPYNARWRLESRESPKAPWRATTPHWTGYHLEPPTGELRSPPRTLHLKIRDRHWRLLTDAPHPGSPPQLRLGYTPEQVVFLAEGEAPWRLVAGSAREYRVEGMLAPVLDSLRARHGDGWQPATVSLGKRYSLGGEAALIPPRDWTRWLLWGVLVAGTLLVGGFALHLLRRND